MIKFSYTAHFRSNIYSLINESTRKYKSRALVPRTIVFPFHTGTLLDFSYLRKDSKNVKLRLMTLIFNLNCKLFFLLSLETDNEKIILLALRKATERNSGDLNTHIIYAGQHNLDWIDWEPDVLQRIVDTGLTSPMMTFIYMYRVGL